MTIESTTWRNPSVQTTPSHADREILLLTNRLKKGLWRTQELELERESLSVPQWLVLSGLAQNEGGTLTHFSRLLGYDAGSLSRVIHQLRLRKLVMTDRASQDRRNALLQLSDAGFALYQTIESRTAGLPPVLTTALGRRRMMVLGGLMERAIALLEVDAIPSKSEVLSP